MVSSALKFAKSPHLRYVVFALIALGVIGGSYRYARNLSLDGNRGESNSGERGIASSERSQPAPQPRLSEEEFQQRVVPHLTRCASRVEESIGGNLAVLNDLINRAEIRTSRFSEVALSLGSNWRLAKDYVPFTAGGEHEAYLRDQFEELVLSSEDLEREIRLVIDASLREMVRLEGQLFIELRADLEDLPSSMRAGEVSDGQMRQALEQAIRAAATQSSSDFRGAVGQQLVSLIAGEVLAHTAVRLGVSAGILSVGAGAGWATFGVGLVAGILVDSLVSTVWNFWSDPEQDLTRQIQAKLNRMRSLLLEGDSDHPGLRPRLVGLAQERSKAIESVLRELLMEKP